MQTSTDIGFSYSPSSNRLCVAAAELTGTQWRAINRKTILLFTAVEHWSEVPVVEVATVTYFYEFQFYHLMT